jgi:hypothetical protein
MRVDATVFLDFSAKRANSVPAPKNSTLSSYSPKLLKS